jgi:hypothetical protein
MPGGRLVLHVGAMKSGTTFVQSRLFAHRDLLQDRGVRVPGRRRRSQVLAVQQLLRGGGPMWDKHAAAVSRHAGTSVIWMELLGPAPSEVLQRLRESVDADVEVVITARDLNRSIPAMWQETVQNGRSGGWHDYVIGARADRPSARRGPAGTEPGRAFWIQQDLVRMARTWASVFGADRVTVVTVPPPGSEPELLWSRFASTVGPELDGLTRPAHLAPDPNESLGAASATAMRRLNELLDAVGLPFPQGHQLRKRLLTKQVLAARRSAEPSIGLGVLPWVREEADAQRAGLVDLGVRLVGDWADLTPVDVPGVDPETLEDREVGEAALAGLAGLLVALARDGADASEPDDG